REDLDPDAGRRPADRPEEGAVDRLAHPGRAPARAPGPERGGSAPLRGQRVEPYVAEAPIAFRRGKLEPVRPRQMPGVAVEIMIAPVVDQRARLEEDVKLGE